MTLPYCILGYPAISNLYKKHLGLYILTTKVFATKATFLNIKATKAIAKIMLPSNVGSYSRHVWPLAWLLKE
jgi:hypothetical protein